MTSFKPNRIQFVAGDRVKWNDPDGGICTNTGTITEVDDDNEGVYPDTMITLKTDDGGEVECLAQELELLTMTATTVTKEQAMKDGFAAFNGGPHLCITVPDGHSTVTAKTSDGKMITFAFCPYEGGQPPKSVDVKYHGQIGKKRGTSSSNHDMAVDVRGLGPLYYSSSIANKKDHVSLVVIGLNEVGE